VQKDTDDFTVIFSLLRSTCTKAARLVERWWNWHLMCCYLYMNNSKDGVNVSVLLFGYPFIQYYRILRYQTPIFFLTYLIFSCFSFSLLFLFFSLTNSFRDTLFLFLTSHSFSVSSSLSLLHTHTLSLFIFLFLPLWFCPFSLSIFLHISLSLFFSYSFSITPVSIPHVYIFVVPCADVLKVPPTLSLAHICPKPQDRIETLKTNTVK